MTTQELILPDPDRIEAFRNQVKKYYGEGARVFPWRNHPEPYGVMVSEFMLQQTQTKRVMGYFQPFLEDFPDFRALASAPAEKVLARWQGLGYNRRGMYLQQAARIVANEYGGILPADRESLVALPGIGVNTAGAILCFAYDLPVPFLETNIKAALIHEFFRDADKVTDASLALVNAAVMDRQHPRQWYYALVDLGVEIKKQFGNPARRSAAYRKQTAFEGSPRQVRGSILRILLAEGSLSVPCLEDKVASELGITGRSLLEPRFMQALNGLTREGLVIAEKDGKYGPPV